MIQRHPLRLILAAILLAAFSAFAGPAIQAQEPGRGAINIISPEIFLTPADGSETRIGMPTTISVGERLRTNETGVALITWLPDGTEFAVGPNTRLTLKEFDGDRESGFHVLIAQDSGQLRLGIGEIGAAGGASVWQVALPAFTVSLYQGRFELRVADDETSTLIVTEGRAEVGGTGPDALQVGPHEFVSVQVGAPLPAQAERLSPDGVEVNLADVCIGQAKANVNVRIAPSENSRRLGGLVEGQRFWVRAMTEGRLWLQIYYRTSEEDLAAHHYGWIYGPIVELDEQHCDSLLRAPLDAQIFGGPGAGHTSDEDDSADTGEAESAGPEGAGESPEDSGS